jgi:hypothetical protein
LHLDSTEEVHVNTCPPDAVATDPWELLRTLWVIQVAPAPGEATLLQAEVEGKSYVLCFTSNEKARAVIAGLSVDGAWTARVPTGHSVDLVGALCQLGAIGIIMDLDPQTHRCAWSRNLAAMA